MPPTTQVVPFRPEHTAAAARICFDAFGALHRRHNTPPDFDSPDTAAMLIGMFASRPDIAGFAAMQDGRVVGSNFLCFTDPVAGVGPITVDPECQARGIGRALMQAVLEEAARRDISRVRLVQEAINTTSLSLYTSLGFRWRDSLAIMRPAGTSSNSVRPLVETDLDAVDGISRSQYGQTRRGEVSMVLRAGMPAFALDRSGRVRGYLIPGFLGHAFAESIGDMADLIGHAASHAPEGFQKVLVPLSQADLFAELLRRGCRTIKVMSYMTLGEFTPPRTVWMPSILN